jgi:uncharacterized protein YhbP (UPF0306 family)
MQNEPNGELRHLISRFLAAQSTLALATVNAEGEPEVAPVFYVHDEALNLYWLSSTKVRHSLNVSAQPSVAATIYPMVWEWQHIVGVQVEGRAAVIVDPGERETILTRYQQKFVLPESFAAPILASTLYVLRPRWLRWIDNSVSFGHKVVLEW